MSVQQRSGPVIRGEVTIDIPTLVTLLREAEEHHGSYEATAPKHHWSGWYAAFISARERGSTAKEAAGEAGLYMAGELAKQAAGTSGATA